MDGAAFEHISCAQTSFIQKLDDVNSIFLCSFNFEGKKDFLKSCSMSGIDVFRLYSDDDRLLAMCC